MKVLISALALISLFLITLQEKVYWMGNIAILILINFYNPKVEK